MRSEFAFRIVVVCVWWQWPILYETVSAAILKVHCVAEPCNMAEDVFLCTTISTAAKLSRQKSPTLAKPPSVPSTLFPKMPFPAYSICNRVSSTQIQLHLRYVGGKQTERTVDDWWFRCVFEHRIVTEIYSVYYAVSYRFMNIRWLCPTTNTNIDLR